MKKYGTAQTFGSFSANCDGRQLRFQPGNIRKRTGYLKLRRTTGIGRDNKSRPGTTDNRPGTTGNRPGTAGTAPEYPKPMRTQVPATEKAAGTIECP
jgi:hypothetical protein